jgi:hypothetical protein
MAKVFEDILVEAASKGIVNLRAKESINWFQTNVARLSNNIKSDKYIRQESGNLVNSWTNLSAGKLYFAYYDPKTKAKLPYYDSFPMIIPIEKYDDGFLGLNLHYLPPQYRAKLLDALYDTLNNTKFDEKTKMIVNYKILKSAAKFRYFEPCVKRYLGSHFRSRFIAVPSNNWTPAIFLPVENFEKAGKSAVWKDSRELIKNK